MRTPCKKKFFLFASDVTPAIRPYAKTLDDKGIVYHPNPAPGNKPIAVGHAYSVLAYLPEKTKTTQSNWVVPLSVDRVKTSNKGHEMGPEKLCDLIDDHTLSLNRNFCVHVGDGAYFTPSIRKKSLAYDDLVSIARIRSDRTVYEKADPSSTKKYGDKMKLNESDTHKEPDKIVAFETVTATGRPIKIEIKVWYDRLLRGTNEFRGYENPFNLFQICVHDAKTKKKLFKRPLWLAVDGKRRNELSARTVYDSYRQRYDIEHFFRFGKQKLLMTGFQTPDVIHEEKWWQIVQLTYSQLYLGRDVCELFPSDWERYLPRFKQQDDNSIASEVSPSLAQRAFHKVLQEIGTPAKDVRKVKPGEGRQKGEKQEKRTVKPVIFKSKKKGKVTKTKEPKVSPGRICGFEKQADVPKPKNKDALIEILKSWMPEINISKEDLLFLLAKELPA